MIRRLIETKMRRDKKVKEETKTLFSEQIFYNIKKLISVLIYVMNSMEQKFTTTTVNGMKI